MLTFNFVYYFNLLYRNGFPVVVYYLLPPEELRVELLLEELELLELTLLELDVLPPL